MNTNVRRLALLFCCAWYANSWPAIWAMVPVAQWCAFWTFYRSE